MGVELLLCTCVIIAIDQLSKQFVMHRFAQGRCSSSGPLVRIRPITHVRRGLQLARNRLALLFLWSFIVLSSIFLIHFGALFQSQVAQVGLGAAMGGATSNLCDMLWRRAIIDFIDVGFWPVFNLADAAIVLGVVVALWFAR